MGRGRGQAVGWIDYGPEHDLLWIVFMDASRECWQVPTPEIRAQVNWSMGRRGEAPDGAPRHSFGEATSEATQRPEGSTLPHKAQ